MPKTYRARKAIRPDAGDVRERLVADLTEDEFRAVERACEKQQITISQFIAEHVVADAIRVNSLYPVREVRVNRSNYRRRMKGQRFRVVSYVSGADRNAVRLAAQNLKLSESQYIARVVVPAAKSL